MISGLPKSERQCPVECVQGVQFNDDLEEEKDYLVPGGEIKTLDDLPLENFVLSDLLPSIHLTKDKANNVDTDNFEQKQKELVKLTKKAKLDEKRIKDLQEQVILDWTNCGTGLDRALKFF